RLPEVARRRGFAESVESRTCEMVDLASSMLEAGSMKQQHISRRSKAVTRRKTHQPTRSSAVSGVRRGPDGVRAALVPHIVTFGILAGATTAFAGGAKGMIAPPPGVPLLYFLAAVTFFVLGALM